MHDKQRGSLFTGPLQVYTEATTVFLNYGSRVLTFVRAL